MLIASYQEWKAEQVEALRAENPLLECPRCDGEGEVYESCPCCGAEKDDECPVCEGGGKVRFEDAPRGLQDGMISRSRYQGEVIADLKKWCAYTREDFLDVVAAFIKEFRGSSRTWR